MLSLTKIPYESSITHMFMPMCLNVTKPSVLHMPTCSTQIPYKRKLIPEAEKLTMSDIKI